MSTVCDQQYLLYDVKIRSSFVRTHCGLEPRLNNSVIDVEDANHHCGQSWDLPQICMRCVSPSLNYLFQLGPVLTWGVYYHRVLTKTWIQPLENWFQLFIS